MNNLLIGLPLLSALFGSTAVLYAGLTSLPFNVLLYTYGVWRLGTAGGPLPRWDPYTGRNKACMIFDDRPHQEASDPGPMMDLLVRRYLKQHGC